MQVFGYDIGIAITNKEKDLHRVGICSCHVQRIPHDSTPRFDQTQTFPSLSIYLPELSPFAQWWRNNQTDAQLFFNQIFKMERLVPQEMTARSARGIVELQLVSKSMWWRLTMEDLFAWGEETARLGDGKIAIDRLARESTEWTGEITGMIGRVGQRRNVVIASGLDKE
jgi:hypothetical protein